jgi:hypothetical protein
VTLVSPGSLNGRSRWLLRARFWKLVLSQTRDGYWDCSNDAAFALQARAAEEVAAVPPSLLTKIRNFFGAAVEYFDEEDHGHQDEGLNAAVEALTEDLQSGERHKQRRDNAFDAAEGEAQPGSALAAPAGGRAYALAQAHSRRRSTLILHDPTVPDTSLNNGAHSSPFGPGSSDDPLACSVDAITSSIPPRLLAVQQEHPNVDVLRVWTTFCCCSLLQELPVSWIWGDGAGRARSAPCATAR